MKRLLRYFFLILFLSYLLTGNSFSMLFNEIETLKTGIVKKKSDEYVYVFATSNYKIGKFEKIGYYAGKAKIKKNGNLNGKIFFFPNKGYSNPVNYECNVITKKEKNETRKISIKCINAKYDGYFYENTLLTNKNLDVKLIHTNSGFENAFAKNLNFNFLQNYQDLKIARNNFIKNNKLEILCVSNSFNADYRLSFYECKDDEREIKFGSEEFYEAKSFIELKNENSLNLPSDANEKTITGNYICSIWQASSFKITDYTNDTSRCTDLFYEDSEYKKYKIFSRYINNIISNDKYTSLKKSFETQRAKKNQDENQLIDDPEKLKELISKAKNPEPGTYSIGDSDAIVANTISNTVKGCWSIPLGLPATEKNLMVRIKLKLRSDGSVAKSEIIDHQRMNKPGQGFYKVLAESALRAVKLCSPFNVKVANNQEILLKFDARNILFGTPSIEDKKIEIAKAETSQTQKVAQNIKFCVNNHRSYDTKTNEYKYKIRRFDNPYYTCNSNFIIDQNYKDELFYAYLVDTIGIVEEKNFRTLEPLGYWKPKIPIKQKKKVKVAKVEESKQEEFKPEDKDNDAPIIEIAENITVNDSNYEIKGKVIDKSKKLFVQVDGETIAVKNGKFSIPRFSPIDEQLKIVAIDQWGNKSKPKIVNVTVDIKETIVADKLEQLNPSLIKSRSNKNRVALIIGIEKYEQTPAANFANLDAQYFYEYARKGFGIPKANIKLLVDEEASLIKSISTINKWLPSKIKNNQTELILFFAGHGLASNNGEELYILPQDSDPDLLSRTALSRTELFEQIIKLNPKSVTMFMDTCYSGISRDEKMLLASARPIRIVADDQEGIPDNFTIFTASKLDQISSGLKEAEHGIFSYYLMKGLEGKADSNQDKKITNGELLSYMNENVSQKAAELGREQNPSLAGDPDKVLISYR